MKKVLTPILLLVLLLQAPLVLQAQGTTNPDGGFAPAGVFLDKNVVADPTTPNNYTINLEAYVTGKTTKIEVSKPLDVVFVTDVSGSMDDTFYSYSYQAQSSRSYTTDGIYRPHFGTRSTSYYYLYNGEYYNVKTKNEGDLAFAPAYYLFFTANDGIHYLKDTGIQTNKPSAVGNSFLSLDAAYRTIYTGVLYKRVQTSSTTKTAAMKAAATAFVDQIAADAATGVEHRISVVKFASDKSNRIGNDTSWGENYSQIVRNLTTDYNDVKTAIASLNAGGATSADYGMQLAQTVLASARPDAYKAVIMLTDGQPNHSSDFSPSVATSTVVASKALKDAGVFVYTIYVGDEDDINEPLDPTVVDNGGSDIDDSERMWNYMNAVSSNYPNATDYKGNGLGTRGEGDYFFKVTSASELSIIFSRITEEIIDGGASVELTAEATTVVDIVAESFKLPDNATSDDIILSVAACTGVNTTDPDNPVYTFGTPVPASSKFPAVAATVDDKTVTVSGFDYSENFVGLDGDVPHGYKLIISFPIEIDPANPGGASVATNTSESGIYYDKGDGNGTQQIGGFQVPYAKIPNLLVIKNGLHQGESATFRVIRVDDSGQPVSGITPFVLVATCNAEGQPAVARIKIQKPGRYRVEETEWSWAYNITSTQATYDNEDSSSITSAQWNEKGFGPAADGYQAPIPTTFGTAITSTSITRNVNDFTESPTYHATLFIFTNADKENNPSHAESMQNNVFYISNPNSAH